MFVSGNWALNTSELAGIRFLTCVSGYVLTDHVFT
jgi:hypothetical protein